MAGTTPKFNLTRLLNERSREAAVQENKEEKTAEIATPEDGGAVPLIFTTLYRPKAILQRGRCAGLETVHRTSGSITTAAGH